MAILRGAEAEVVTAKAGQGDAHGRR
jgi:hypothetical protein